MFMRRKNHMAPARIILIGFALLILAGALLLTLPISTRDGQGAAFFDALFTATSATCVTGLVVQDTALYWSGFGQAVILMLIQIGGMGVVTAAAAISMLAGRRIGLKERWVMQESISAPQVGGIVRRTRFILAVTLVLEGTGTLLLALRFCPEMGLFRGLWYAVFHAVSSFCNAGFDLMGAAGTPFVSLTGYAGDPLVNFTVMGLIVLGGIGFLTWGDVREHKWHLRAYCLQSKLVLATTGMEPTLDLTLPDTITLPDKGRVTVYKCYVDKAYSMALAAALLDMDADTMQTQLAGRLSYDAQTGYIQYYTPTEELTRGDLSEFPTDAQLEQTVRERLKKFEPELADTSRIVFSSATYETNVSSKTVDVTPEVNGRMVYGQYHISISFDRDGNVVGQPLLGGIDKEENLAALQKNIDAALAKDNAK
mgnify:CR=1 FL=1